MRFSGWPFHRKVPPHVEEAEAAVDEVSEATAEGKAAVRNYWAEADRRIAREYARAEPDRRKR